MSGYLIDTSALSAYYRPTHPKYGAVAAKLDALPANALRLVSVVTLAEAMYGLAWAERATGKSLPELRERVERIATHAHLEISHHTSAAYADLKCRVAVNCLKPGKKKMPRYLEDWVATASSKKLQVGENDLWIAAQAKERDLTVVTCDEGFRVFQSADVDLKLIVI
jgi:predicted nucleic acid-binding protein